MSPLIKTTLNMDIPISTNAPPATAGGTSSSNTTVKPTSTGSASTLPISTLIVLCMSWIAALFASGH